MITFSLRVGGVAKCYLSLSRDRDLRRSVQTQIGILLIKRYKKIHKYQTMDYLNYVCEKIFGIDVGSAACSTAVKSKEEDICNISAPRKIIAFGNVLLDYTVELKDTAFLESYNIKLGSKGELDLEKIIKITEEATAAASNEAVKHPGGSALNTVRILKQLGHTATFFGAIGADNAGQVLADILHERDIEVCLQTIPNIHTGQCICLKYGDRPTLYANIGASAHFTSAKLEKVAPLVLRPLERKQVIYIESFFVPERVEVCKFIVKSYIKGQRRLAINLSASYILQDHYAPVLELLQYAYFIFGNYTEFQTLCKAMHYETFEEMAQNLLYSGAETEIIVITNGSKGAQLITNCGGKLESTCDIKFESYNAPRVEVVDGTGAGDAFVAGFLNAWLQKRTLSECMRVATDVAAKVVTQVGCNLP